MIKDIKDLNKRFDITNTVRNMEPNLKKEYLDFRINFIKEELTELQDARHLNNADDIVDAFIDLVVVALGTLDSFDVDIEKAWARVHFANMIKEKDINDKRENKHNLPDLIKPELWKAPYHQDNVGTLKEIKND
ncbi:MAG: putative phosphoribosyl-ATP pyrophosphohydrolase [Prokaryotic dsDNA virus sp.]|jgi:hypothetical protein|nr:MAG: putative phosphoribosyl-ATP pyrophosphohydrolase [Prokaryotic dsDNA virus sp.]|tara:strand:+ start:1754 stop:2155 length:402 start_codon:yes stop_codon:yes gene_type:complete